MRAIVLSTITFSCVGFAGKSKANQNNRSRQGAWPSKFSALRTYSWSLLIILNCGLACAAPAYVQSTGGIGTSAVSTYSLTMPANTVAGDLIAGYVHWNSNSVSLTGITGCGGTFTLVNNPTSGGSQRAAGFYAPNIAGGGCVVTATFSGSVSMNWMLVHEISGLAAAPFDGSALRYQSSPGSSANAVSSGSIRTSVSGDYIFAATSDEASNASYSAGTGFKGRLTGIPGLASEDAIHGPAGSVSGTFTASPSSTNNFTLVMAFKPVPPPFDFSLATSASPSIAQGASGKATIAAGLVSGAASPVTFSAAGLPSGASAGFAPASCSPGCSTTLTITAAANAALGAAVVTVTGTAGAIVHTTPLNVTITDGGKPSVSMASPASGAILAGTATISASASDNVGVAGVQFLLDGAALGGEITAAPYALAWYTATATNAVHSLAARARDAAGNTATSTALSITVDNQAPSIPAGLSATALSASQIKLAWSASTDNLGVTGYRVFRGGVPITTVATAGFTDGGLTPSTAYTYSVAAFDAAGNTSNQSASASATTKVLDVTPPVISAITNSAPTSSTVTILWTTDEPSDSQVDYGLTNAYGQTSTLNANLVTSHSVALSGLMANSLYHFEVKSKDASSNLAVSVDYTFLTTNIPVISLVNHSQSVSCGNTVTCLVALKGPVTPANFLVVTAWAINPVYVVSLGAGGTYVDGYVRNGSSTGDTRGYLSGGYVLSATACSGSIVVTFSGATGGAQVNIREYAVSGGNLVLDAASDNLTAPTTNPIASPALTLTGANDLIVSWAGASTNIASVASPFGNADIANDKTGSGTADLLNVTAAAPASWTAAGSPTGSALASMAFGFQPQPCGKMAAMNSNAGVAGSSITAASLVASTVGTSGNGNGAQNWTWSLGYTGSTFTWSAAAHRTLTTPMRFCNGGQTYSDTSTTGMQYNIAGGTAEYLEFYFPGQNLQGAMVSPSASLGVWFYTTLPQTATVNADILTIWGWSSGNNFGFNNLILVGDGTKLNMRCEFTQIACSTYYPVQSNKWYWLTLRYSQGGTHQIAVYDEALNIVASFSAPAGPDTAPARLFFGYSNSWPGSTPGYFYFDKLKFCYLGPCGFPVLP